MEYSPRIPGSFYTEIETISTTSSHEPVQPLRKRPRLDRTAAITPQLKSHGYGSDSTQSFDLASPSPLANTRYRLAGGLDTPGGWQAQDSEYFQELEAEQDYRPNRSHQIGAKTRLASERENADSSRQKEQNVAAATAWCLGKTAWAMTGGLAGKIFNFCWNTTFHGFSAGGGTSYDMDSKMPNLSPSSQASNGGRKDVFSSSYIAEIMPGDFPGQSSRLESAQSQNLASPLTPGGSSSWVIVNRSKEPGYFDGSVRKRSRASIAGRRSVSRSSLGVQNTNSTSASYASSRSRPTGAAFVKPRPSSGTTSPIKPTFADEVPIQRPRSSLASPHKRQSSIANIQANSSPISPEIDEYRRKRRREDKKQDESLRKLNDQLQAMIRQGKEALGAKIEVVDDSDTDEGYFDDISH